MDKDVEGGIAKKIRSQIISLNQFKLNIELILIIIGDFQIDTHDFLSTYKFNLTSGMDFFNRIIRTIKIRKIFHDTIQNIGSKDIFYCRYLGPLPTYYPYNYLKIFRTCKIITEHQTKELDEYKVIGNSLLYWFEFFFGKFIKKQSDAIIGVTDEIVQYEIIGNVIPQKPYCTIGNGFSIQSVPIRLNSNSNSENLHLLFVANISRWHGLDRLLEGISSYGGDMNIKLHVTGDGAELQNLIDLTQKLRIREHVIYHGFLTGEKLDNLFNTCHIAVGSLGIHRIGLTESSTLKVREYCARGIPWIIACKDPDFPDDFPYIHRIPADESPVNIEEVIEFAKKVYADPDHPQKMREYAFEHLDWSVKMKKLKAFLESLVDESPSEA